MGVLEKGKLVHITFINHLSAFYFSSTCISWQGNIIILKKTRFFSHKISRNISAYQLISISVLSLSAHQYISRINAYIRIKGSARALESLKTLVRIVHHFLQIKSFIITDMSIGYINILSEISCVVINLYCCHHQYQRFLSKGGFPQNSQHWNDLKRGDLCLT